MFKNYLKIAFRKLDLKIRGYQDYFKLMTFSGPYSMWLQRLQH